MKNKIQFLVLLIGISFFSCNSTVNNLAIPISNIDTDFPITEKLEFKAFNKYDILGQGYCMIDNSALWFIKEGKSDFGSCYNLNTGKKISTIASRGRASNELTGLEEIKIIGDSVQFYTGRNTIKTFAKKDITDNILMGDREFSVTVAPDSILVYRMVKLPNGSVLATIQPALEEFQKGNINEFNEKSVAIFNNKEANSYETIKYESFNVKKAKGTELPTNDLIKLAYSDGIIELKDNDMAVLSVSAQFILYTFDFNSGNVVNEKRYTEIQRIAQVDERSVPSRTMNDKSLSIHSMKTNNQYILCIVKGYLSEEDKDSKLGKEAIFVFDWDLNPIKKFDLPKRKNGYYTISNDGSSVYFCESNDDGLTLYKADLNI